MSQCNTEWKEFIGMVIPVGNILALPSTQVDPVQVTKTHANFTPKFSATAAESQNIKLSNREALVSLPSVMSMVCSD